MNDTIKSPRDSFKWHRKYGPQAPKRGEVATDFELRDVNGVNPIRLGTPSWAHAAMGRAVSAGVLSGRVRGDDLVNRFEFAVVVDDRLGLLIDGD